MKESPDPRVTARPWPVVYGAALVATVAAALLRLALNPLVGETAVPFITFFPAVLFSAWYGGFRVGAFSILLSALAANYYFVAPRDSFLIPSPGDQVTLLIFIVVGFGMALLGHSQRRALERADRQASLRRDAELAERAERQRFETTLASIGDGVIATDADGRISFMNDVAESLTGWRLEEVSGLSLENVFRIVNEETRRPVENPARWAMQEGRIVGLANHTVLIARDGTEIPIDDSGSPVRNAAGKTLGAVLIFRDITQRRKADKERELLAQQALTLNSGFDAIVVRDPHDRITSWNRVAEQLYGWTAGEALGRVTHSLFNTVFPKPLAEITVDLHRDNHWGGELIHTCKDGRAVTVLSHWILDRGSQDQPRSVLEINIDMSSRRRLEQMQAELLERERRALQSESKAREEAEGAEQRLQLALDAGHMGTWQYMIRTGEVLWSTGLEHIHGYEPGTFPGTFDAFRDEIHPEDRERVLRAIGAAIEQHGAHHIEYRIVRRDGSVRWVEGRGQLFLDVSGQPNRMVGVCADITERKQAAEAESQARHAAEQANRAKDEFLAMLSHELRNPLSSILGWAVMLRTEQIPPERARHALEVIERNARVEAHLVESLLDLSRITAGKLKLDRERVHLSGVLESVLDSLRPAADTKGVALSMAAPEGSVMLIGDSSRLQQIFSNLLANAVKFTPRGGEVEVWLTRTGSQAQVQVVDNGEGIDAGFLPNIFDPFRQAESAKGRAHGGLGLGLAIVRELVHAHGGAVVAESRGKGQGSTFTVTLPVPAVIPAHIEAASPQLAHTDEPSISGLRVLVVDDDADARELVALTLQSGGAVVRTASSAADALDHVRREKPDVMIADIGMPHEDGYVLIQKLRAVEREHSQHRLSAIALTAYASAADRDQALAAGYDLHLTKPVGHGDLTRGVARLRKSLRA